MTKITLAPEPEAKSLKPAPWQFALLLEGFDKAVQQTSGLTNLRGQSRGLFRSQISQVPRQQKLRFDLEERALGHVEEL